MADDPKKSKDSKGDGKDYYEVAILVFVGLFLLAALLERINFLLNNNFGGGYNSFWETTKLAFLKNVWPAVKILALISTIVFGYGIVTIYKKLMTLSHSEKLIYSPKKESENVDIEEPKENDKWKQVQTHINTKNPAEWRLAIIEADVMLDELLKSMGYHGDTVGDRLKAVEPGEITTLESAWEAHKVRNRIAHEGNSFQITEREARRVITLFESVFRESKII